MAFRGAIPDFQLANPLYVGATVSFFTVDATGHKTTTLATLFADPTSAQTASNPQVLDSEGKFSSPVYIEVPVIAEVLGPNVPDHTTGVINPRGTWRGAWVTNTVYYATDFIQDPVSGNVYAAEFDYTSGATIAADIAAGDLLLIIDQTAIVSGGASLAIKVPVQVATTANLTLSGLQTIDGYTTLAGDRVLVKNQSNAAQNGLYNAAVGAWTRTSDLATSAMIANGTVVDVLNGTMGRNQRYRASIATPFTLGTSFMTWAADQFPNSQIIFQFGSAADSTISTGPRAPQTIPYNGTIVSATLLSNVPGSIVVDLWKTSFANAPPNVGNSITGGNPPTLSNQQIKQDSTLSGWTTTCLAGDVILPNVNSCAGLAFVTLVLQISRS